MSAGGAGEACGVCEEVFDGAAHEPVALPACGHTFCRTCLLHLQTLHHALCCPVCRAAHNGEDVASLPTNYLVLSLLSNAPEKQDNSEAAGDTDIAATETSGTREQHLAAAMDGETGSRDSLTQNKENLMLSATTDKRTQSHDSLAGEEDGYKMSDASFPHYWRETTDPQDQSLMLAEGSRENQDKKKKNRCLSWKLCLAVGVFLIILAGTGAMVAIFCAPHVIEQMGFTKKGVAKGSYGAKLMSAASRENKGAIPKDHWVAWLQQAGHKGLDSTTQTYLGVGGAAAGLLLAVLVLLLVAASFWAVRKFRNRNRYTRDQE